MDNRNFFREVCEIPFKFETVRYSTRNSGVILDISAGGLRLETSELLEIGHGNRIRGTLKINDHNIPILGEVVAAYRELEVPQYGLKFINMRAGDEDKILKFVLELQRQRRNQL